MNREELAAVLEERFAAGTGERRAVCRQAGDLADSGQYERDAGVALTPDAIARHLADAPDAPDATVTPDPPGPPDASGGGLASRWNWWMGALEVAYGGYAAFQVRRFRGESGGGPGRDSGRETGPDPDETGDDPPDGRFGP